jgi:hypothetical protein
MSEAENTPREKRVFMWISLKEQEEALRQAGINPDPSQWSERDLRRAEEVLDTLERGSCGNNAGQSECVERLVSGKTTTKPLENEVFGTRK